MEFRIAHSPDLALASPIQSFNILLNPLLIDIWVLIPLTTQCHVEHPTCQLGLRAWESHSSPFGLHAQLALDGLDEILVVDPPESLFEEEDLLI